MRLLHYKQIANTYKTTSKSIALPSNKVYKQLEMIAEARYRCVEWPTGFSELWKQYVSYREEQGDFSSQRLSRLVHGHWYKYKLPGVEHSYNLFPAELLNETPGATVVIPVATPGEDPANVLRTLDALCLAASRHGPLEVVLWCNTKYTPIKNGDDEAKKRNTAILDSGLESFDKLAAEVDARTYPDDRLRIRIAHTYMQENENFNDIRSQYMDSLCLDAETRNFPASHPFIWLDGDMTFIQPDGLDLMIDALIANEAHFVKANLLFTGEDTTQVPFAQRSPQEKVAAIYAIGRRMMERYLPPEEAYGYIDECGLGFRLETYLKSGGVALRYPDRGESRTLLLRGQERLDKNVPLFKRIKEARMGTWYRRFQLLANYVMPVEIPFSDQGENYLDYQTMMTRRPAPLIGNITEKSVRQMTDMMVFNQEFRAKRPIPALTKKRLASIVTRAEFQKV